MAKKEAVKDAAPAQAVGRPLAPAAKPPGPGEAAHRLTAQILAPEPLREPAGFVWIARRTVAAVRAAQLLPAVPGAGRGNLRRLRPHGRPMALSRSARAVASEGPYQVSSRPETSTARWAGNSSGPSSAVNG
jgi:hypothetical protein